MIFGRLSFPVAR